MTERHLFPTILIGICQLRSRKIRVLESAFADFLLGVEHSHVQTHAF
jgi:hypothetical protein